MISNSYFLISLLSVQSEPTTQTIKLAEEFYFYSLILQGPTYNYPINLEVSKLLMYMLSLQQPILKSIIDGRQHLEEGQIQSIFVWLRSLCYITGGKKGREDHRARILKEIDSAFNEVNEWSEKLLVSALTLVDPGIQVFGLTILNSSKSIDYTSLLSWGDRSRSLLSKLLHRSTIESISKLNRVSLHKSIRRSLFQSLVDSTFQNTLLKDILTLEYIWQTLQLFKDIKSGNEITV